ncbi:MAG: hypothetical protein WDM77_19560 [Steroidobacteraceae bacterium]
MTTVNLTYRRTWNNAFKMECIVHDDALHYPCVEKVHDPAIGVKDMDERSYGAGLTQILTRNSIISANFEVITNEGALSDPYPLDHVRDPRQRRGLRAGAGGDAEHPYQQRTGPGLQVLPALAGRVGPAVPLLSGHLAYPRANRADRLHPALAQFHF